MRNATITKANFDVIAVASDRSAATGMDLAIAGLLSGKRLYPANRHPGASRPFCSGFSPEIGWDLAHTPMVASADERPVVRVSSEVETRLTNGGRTGTMRGYRSIWRPTSNLRMTQITRRNRRNLSFLRDQVQQQSQSQAWQWSESLS